MKGDTIISEIIYNAETVQPVLGNIDNLFFTLTNKLLNTLQENFKMVSSRCQTKHP